jgi:hypothetical protein
MDELLCYVMKLAREYLPKLTVAILLVGMALILVTAQPNQVAAASHWKHNWNSCGYYSYYNCYSYSYYYSYPYYYSYGYPYYWNNSYGYSYYGNSYYGYPYYGNSYYGNPYSSNYYSNYYSPSSYTLSVATNPSNLGTVTGGGTYTPGSSASFSVTQNTVQVSPNTRYTFSHWSGDYSGVSTSGTVTVNNAMKITAIYQLQYYLTVNVQPQSVPVPQGAGWYNANATATLQSSGQTIGGDGGNRLAFQGWSVDGQAPQASPTLAVQMNAPHTVTSVYNQQYYLNVQTDQGTPYGTGWYDAGSTAQAYVSTPISTTYGVNNVFNGWQGGIQSNNQTASVLMDGPKNVIATWRTDPTVLYLTIAGLVIAALLVVGGIIAVLTRRRNTTQTTTQTTKTTTNNPKTQTAEDTSTSTSTDNPA